MQDLKESGLDNVVVKITKIFDPQTSTFNGKSVTSMGAYVTCNNVEYKTYFKEKDFDKAQEGNVLRGLKKLYRGSAYYEWYLEAPSQTAHIASTPQEVKRNESFDRSKEIEGKVRNNIAVAFIQQGKPLNDLTKQEMNKWVDYVINS